jgi:hypothetical protein
MLENNYGYWRDTTTTFSERIKSPWSHLVFDLFQSVIQGTSKFYEMEKIAPVLLPGILAHGSWER